MKNIYLPLYQKILIFCVFFLGGQLTFAQTLPDPTGLTSSQTVCYNESVTLTGTCSSGELHWFDVLSNEITSLTFNATETATYFAVCQSVCSCEMSNSVPVTITVDRPFDITRTQSICLGSDITLSASCPRGAVTWYNGADTMVPLISNTVSPTTETTYVVRCEDTVNACESLFESVTIHVFSSPNSIPVPVSPVTTCVGGNITLSATCDTGADAFFFLDDEVTEIEPVVENVTTNTTYKVRCESLTACPSSFASINVEVSSPPFPTGVTSSQSVCIGESVLLLANCDADSDPYWYLDDETTLVLSTDIKPTSTTTYKVRCESTIHSGCYGPFESTTITTLSDITTQPTSLLVCLGSSATFSVAASGTPTFQWQKKQENGLYVNIPLATASTFTIDSTVLASRGYYRCRVVGTCDSYSEEVFLSFPQTILDKNKLVPPQVTALDEFGNSAAISDSLAVVGAWSKSHNKGAAYIFKMNPNGKWTQMAQLAPTDLQEEDDFGASVAISGDTVFVSAPGQDGDRGVVYVFRKQTNNTWTQLTKITAIGGASGDYFGSSIAVANNYLAIGATDYETVYIYKKDNTGNWIYEDEVFDGSIGSYFGQSVSLSGNTLVVGAVDEADAGAIFVYERDNSGNWELKDRLAPNNLDLGAGFGFATGISGNTIVASGFVLMSGKSVVQVYEKDLAGNWLEKTRLTSEDLADDAGLGFSVAIHNNTIVLGGPGNVVGKGAAVVYEKNIDGDWIQKRVIIPADLASGDQFGTSVAISKTSIVVGASFIPSLLSINFGTGGAYFYSQYTYPIPAIATVTQNAAVCPAQSTTFTLSGFPSTDTYTVTYKVDLSGTEKTIVVTPDTTRKASFLETLVWANNAKNLYITKIKNNATNCERALNISSPVSVKAPTEITGNPTRQVVCVGETAVFMGEATGEGILTYQWQRQAPVANGVNAPFSNDFSDITILSLPNRTLADNGAKYRVKVTGECGVAISDEAPLTVWAKATAIMSAGGAVCPGSIGTLMFTGTPFAQVYYKYNGFTTSVLLDANGSATMQTGILTEETTFTLVSINVEGKCNQLLSGSATISVLPSGGSIQAPLVLTSPTNDVLASGVQSNTAQTIEATNKISSGGKATHIGNKYVLIGPGFEATAGSVYLAKITSACP